MATGTLRTHPDRRIALPRTKARPRYSCRPPDLGEEVRDPLHLLHEPLPAGEGIPELRVDLLGHLPYTLPQFRRFRAPVNDGDEVMAALLDHDPSLPERQALHVLVDPLAEGVLHEFLDDLEHPDEDVLVLVLDEARGAVGQEDAAVVHDEDVVDDELSCAAAASKRDDARSNRDREEGHADPRAEGERRGE